MVISLRLAVVPLNPYEMFKRSWALQHDLIDYRKSSIKRRGAYFKLKIFGAALNRGRRLFEGGAYSKGRRLFKNNIFDMKIFFSISKNKQVYKLNTKHQCPRRLLHLDQAADSVHRLLQRQTQ